MGDSMGDEADLRRKFRVLENDKRAYGEEVQMQIRKQRAAVDKLTRENRKLKVELNEQRSVTNANQNVLLGEKMTSLNEACDTTQKKLEAELLKKREMTTKKTTLDERIMRTREKMGSMGGVNAARETNEAISKQIRVLENRLDKALQKFNEAVAHNKSLRESIDGLRRERVVFDSIYKKLERDLQEKKKEMANIIEVANAAYEARDQAQQQMHALKAQADKEHQEFEKEWKELGRLIENDKKMKEYMKLKEKEREQQIQKGELSLDDEQKTKKRVTKNAWGIVKDKAQLQLSAERVTAYEEAFAKIQAATGISDIDELVQTFINAEDQNFSLFNYANDLSADIEKLEAQISALRTEMADVSASAGTSLVVRSPSPTDAMASEQDKAQFFQKLEERWQRLEKRCEHYEMKYQQTQRILRSIKGGLQSLVQRLRLTGVDSSAVAAAEEDASRMVETVTEGNMMTYLGSIEQRTLELLNLYMRDAGELPSEPPGAAAGVDVLQPAIKGAALGATASQLQIRLPSTVEDYSDDNESDEDEDRPYTREELKIRVSRSSRRSGQRAIRPKK
ncbi:unnamed protein product [Vitrella brassicaformis CCMP3155]|uniref:ODAD1 central coiled coil region domain-containing protein n=2 Tax=Vitrella brassicaformis TaxID=1169539 RepID=A0A0G4GT19_VITBC|nr:unnamed protein product [Vitrella brassicaformis CCMP3155]|eukprot:CEM33805.1 unnamed protein product [Vitrella brassicaformis CCMP3155]